MTCKCYTCRHKDEPKLLTAYLVGYKQACEWFLNWAKRNNIKMGHLGGETIEGIYAEMDCNYIDTCAYLDCMIKDYPEAKDAL